MNYSESMSKRQQRRKALNQRFRRMFLVALLMGLAMGFVFGRCSAVNSKAPDAPIEPDQLNKTHEKRTVSVCLRLLSNEERR